MSKTKRRKALGIILVVAAVALITACTTAMYRVGKEYRVPYQQEECTCVHVDGG